MKKKDTNTPRSVCWNRPPYKLELRPELVTLESVESHTDIAETFHKQCEKHPLVEMCIAAALSGKLPIHAMNLGDYLDDENVEPVSFHSLGRGFVGDPTNPVRVSLNVHIYRSDERSFTLWASYDVPNTLLCAKPNQKVFDEYCRGERRKYADEQVSRVKKLEEHATAYQKAVFYPIAPKCKSDIY